MIFVFFSNKVSVNTNLVYFGTIVIGEKTIRKIQLINKGALKTRFELLKAGDLKKTPETTKNESTDTKSSEGIEIGEVIIKKLFFFQF